MAKLGLLHVQESFQRPETKENPKQSRVLSTFDPPAHFLTCLLSFLRSLL
jgi:hypothetical protein